MTETRITSATGGEKGSKQARYDLIPPGPLDTLARLYGKGAEKYDAHNWRRGYDWSLSFAALQRHAWAFWNGEDIDSEMGLPHLAAVAFHAFALLEFMDAHPGFDDRMVGAELAYPLQCGAVGPREAASPCVHSPGHGGEHIDISAGSWPAHEETS